MAQKPGKSETLTKVQEHYQDLPYPLRDPKDENTRLLTLVSEYLGELNHYLYHGKETFKNKFRVLVAGGGTGDSSTFLAHQLRDTDAEIVYLDFSKPSMEIAQQRAEIRGLKNIRFIHDSILNIPNLDLGRFDFINCSGVLHHLQSPPDGLKILQQSLKPTGGMHIMIYGKYGRTGLYHVQDIMRIVNEDTKSRVEEIANGKIIINSLPKTNWYVRGQELLADHLIYGDVGLYDMFLHKQDRAYSVPEMYEFVKDAGLNFIEFAVPMDRLTMRVENYIKDPVMVEKIKKMDIEKQHAIAELIAGNIIKHSVLISNAKNTQATLDDMDNVPYCYLIANLPEQICDFIEKNPNIIGSTINFPIDNNLGFKDVSVTLPVSICTKTILKQMIGGTKTLTEICDGVRAELGDIITNEAVLGDIKKFSKPLFDTNIMLLRHKSVEFFKHSAS